MNKNRYTVMIDDNFHYMDEEHRLQYGKFSTYEKAVAACKKIVDEELRDMLKQGVIPTALVGDSLIIDTFESGAVILFC